MSQLVTQKFRELTVGLASAHARHKALAGIVMTTGNTSCFPRGNLTCKERRFSVCLILGARQIPLPHEDANKRNRNRTRELCDQSRWSAEPCHQWP